MTFSITGKWDQKRRDYFNGFSPKKLGALSNEALAYYWVRLNETLIGDIGTAEEKAHLAEALQEIYRERLRRRATFHG